MCKNRADWRSRGGLWGRGEACCVNLTQSYDKILKSPNIFASFLRKICNFFCDNGRPALCRVVAKMAENGVVTGNVTIV